MAQLKSALAERALASGLIEAADLARSRAALGDGADDARLLDWLVKHGLLTKWQAAQLEAGRSQNLILGHYKLLAPLGAGGMGSVYRVLDTKLNRQVALKVLPPRLATPNAIGRFRREAFVALQLRHDHVVTSFELAQHGTLHFLAMELVDGPSLSAHLAKQRRLSVRETARIGHEVALALEHARELGIVHRDIKPSNILLSRQGRVKVADMGLAKFFGPQAQAGGPETRTGQFMGTIDYCSPEQAVDAKRADIRSDIYSLGCTLYHCLTGQPPFAEGTEVQRIMAHIDILPASIRVKNRDVPPAFAELIEKRMLAKDPGDRFQTPAEAAEALAPWAKGEEGSSANLWSGLEGLDGLLAVAASGPGIEPPPAARESVRDTARRPRSPATRRVVKLRLGPKNGSALWRPFGWAAVVLVLLGTVVGASLWWARHKTDDAEPVAGPGPLLEGRFIRQPAKPDESSANDRDEKAEPGGGDGLETSGTPGGSSVAPPGTAGRDGIMSGGDALIANLPVAGTAGTTPGSLSGPPIKSAEGLEVDSAEPVPQALWDDNRDAGEDTQFVSGWGGGAAQRIVKPGLLLRGLECKLDKVTRRSGRNRLSKHFPCIADMAPIFTKERPHQLPSGEAATDGFAVGAVKVDVQAYYIKAVQLVYMRVKADGRLDPNDSRVSRWIGPSGGGQIHTLTGNGAPVIGLHLRKTNIVSAIALVVDRKARLVERREWPGIHIYHTAFSQDGRLYLGGGDGGKLRVWEVARDKQVQELPVPVGLLTPGGKYVVGHNFGKSIFVFDGTSGNKERTWESSATVAGLAMAPDGKRVVSSHADNVLRLWDFATGQIVGQFKGHSQPADAVFSSDGKQLLSASEDKSVRLWDVDTGDCLQTFKKFPDAVPINNANLIVRAFFLPGERQIAGYVWGQYKRLLVWDAVSGDVLRSIDLGADFHKDAAISRDGRFLLSAHDDNTVRLRHLSDGSEVDRFTMAALPRGIGFSWDQRYLVSGSLRGWVYLWRLAESLRDPGDERAALPRDRRVKWVYKDQWAGKSSGWFQRNDDGTWTENKDKAGETAIFEESERNADFVLLFDRGRNMYLRCYNDHIDIFNSRDGTWPRLYEGTWVEPRTDQ